MADSSVCLVAPNFMKELELENIKLDGRLTELPKEIKRTRNGTNKVKEGKVNGKTN